MAQVSFHSTFGFRLIVYNNNINIIDIYIITLVIILYIILLLYTCVCVRMRVRACARVILNVTPNNYDLYDYKDIHNLYYHKYPHNQYHYAVILIPLILSYLMVLKLLSLLAGFIYSLT